MSKLLDIEKSAQRLIKSGLQYDHLFPAADMLDKVVYRDGNVKDTVRTMQDVVVKYLGDTVLIAPKLYDKDLENTCHNVWKFIYSHLQYKLDEPGLEQLRRPARAWHDRVNGVDCDCYSIFASSILTNLDIPHAFRITKYDKDWQHVYVIVPNENGHYTIDCVTHEFDYEKPYSAKMDYTMTRLNGIPIAVLSGVGSAPDDELYSILTGTDFASSDTLSGLGDAAAQESELKSIYDHLVRTRDYVQQNPQSVIGTGGAAAHLQMLNYAIANWNTPNRDKALDILEKEEERWNQHNGLSGLIELDSEDVSEDELLGLGKHGQGLKKFWSKVKDAAKKVAQGVKNVAKGIIKYNPLSLAVRGGYLLAMKLNVLDMSSRLYPGYLSESEAKAKGINSDKWQKAKNAIAKVENLFVHKLHGQADKLKNAIMNGRATKHFAGFGSLGEPATITAVTASIIPLVDTAQALNDTGASDSKDDTTKATSKKGFLAMLKKWWKKVFGKEDAVAPETVSDEEKAPDESTGADTTANESGDGTDVTITEGKDKNADGSPGTWENIKIFVKENPGKTALGVAAAVATIAVGVHALMPKKKQTAPQAVLSGQPAPTGQKKKRGGRRKSTRRSKIKSITLK